MLITSVCRRLVPKSCLTLCDPMDCSMPGFPVFHHIPEFAQTLVYWVSEGIQPSHPLLSPSPPVLNLSLRWRLFWWVGSALLIRWPKYWSFSVSPSNEYSGLISCRMTGFICLLSKGLLRIFSRTTILKHQFFGIQSFLWSSPHICTWLLEKP